MEATQWEYTRGAGSVPNRKIVFSNENTRIQAKAFGRSQGSNWIPIGEVKEAGMTTEMQSTSQKVDEMVAARKEGRDPHYAADKGFVQLPFEKKMEILSNLDPIGSWCIEVISNITSEDERFEQVKRLRFYQSN